jgi:hypothetical protein
MGAMRADNRLRTPEELSTFPQEKLDAIVENLTKEGGRMFFREVAQATLRAKVEGDLTPLNNVFEAWYRTLRFVASPDADERWDRADQELEHGRRFTAEEIRARRSAGRPH